MGFHETRPCNEPPGVHFFGSSSPGSRCNCGEKVNGAKSCSCSQLQTCSYDGKLGHGKRCNHGILYGGCGASSPDAPPGAVTPMPRPEPDVSPGARLRGVTSDLVSDDHLRAECERRGIDTSGFVVDPARVTSKGLMAEAHKRGLLAPALKELSREVHAERDEMRKERNAAERRWETAVEVAKRADAAADEWKRRAEAAEARLARVGVTDAVESKTVVIDSSKMKADSIEVGGVVFRAVQGIDFARDAEAGPGIRTGYLRNPKHVATNDEATLADLMAADET